VYYQKKTQPILDAIQERLDYYKPKNIKITIRQLFYDLLDFKEITEEYKHLVRLMTKTRKDGTFPYNAIIDPSREPQIPSKFDDVQDLLQAAIYNYRLDRWKDQDCYVEVWLEKDALTSTIEDIPDKYSVPFQSNHGYSSITAIHEGLERYLTNGHGKKRIMIYIGDHDPSGLDMDENIKNEFWEAFGPTFELVRIALTLDQVQQHQLIPNSANDKDPRYEKYAEKYGNDTWEIEALQTDILREILEDKITSYIDFEKYDKVLEHEEADKEKMRELFDQN